MVTKGGYHEGDGIHLNGVGNSIWIQELKEMVQKAQQKDATGR